MWWEGGQAADKEDALLVRPAAVLVRVVVPNWEWGRRLIAEEAKDEENAEDAGCDHSRF